MSQSIIGALRANLGMNSAQFERGVVRAQSSTEQLRSRLGRLAAGAAAVSAALSAMVASSANAAHELSRMASVANASPEEFQRWAAATASVGIEQDKLADILKDVNDRIGDFLQTGGGEMADFFETIAPRVGLTAEMFRNLSGPEALQLYVDGLQRAGLNQQEMTFYMEAVADEASALIPLLRDNGAELNRLAEASDRFGMRLTSDQVEALNQTRDAFVQLRQLMADVRNQIAARLAPAFNALADAFIRSAQQGGALNSVFRLILDNVQVVTAAAAAFATLMAGQLALGILRATGVMNALAASVALVRSAFLLMAGPVGIAVALIGGGLAVITRLRDLNAELPPTIDDVREAQDLLNVALGNYATGARGSGSEAIAYARNLETTARAALAAAEAQLVLRQARLDEFDADALNVMSQQPGWETNPTRNLVLDVERQQATIQELTTTLENARRTLNALNIEAATGSHALGELVFETGALDDVTESVVETVTEATEALGGMGGGAARATEQIADAMETLRASVQAGAGTLADFLLSLKDGMDATRQAIAQLATQLLRSGLTQLFTNFAGNNPGSIFSTILAGLGGARANGGNVRAGMLYEVNEQGTEYFKPAVNGEVVPLGRTGGGDGGSNVTVQVINMTGEKVETRERQGPDGQRLIEVTVGRAMAEGKFDRVLGTRYAMAPKGQRR